MHQVWPLPSREVDDALLEELYTYPLPDGDDPWVTVNFVSSLDGGIEVDGHSAGLSTPADRAVFSLGHDLADVVLLASGTAVGEDYAGLRPHPDRVARRRRHDLSEVPPLAVVTSGSLPADATSLVDVHVPSLVLTCGAASADDRAGWERSGARVVVSGDDEVDLAGAVRTLAADGMRRIDCEGGPGLVGSLLGADLVDEMRLSFVPLAVAGQAGRVASSPEGLNPPAGFTVASILVDDDGTILVRYLRDRSSDGSSGTSADGS